MLSMLYFWYSNTIHFLHFLMDCQDINNKSSNSIPETLDLHYMSIFRAVTIIITTTTNNKNASVI